MTQTADFSWEGGPGNWALHLTGALTLATLDDLIRRLKGDLEGRLPLRVFLQGVTVIDSAALAFFVDILRHARASGAAMPRFSGVSVSMRELISLYRLEELILLDASEE